METEDLELSLLHIKCIRDLLKGNEYESFFASHLLPIKYELERQITNLAREERSTK